MLTLGRPGLSRRRVGVLVLALLAAALTARLGFWQIDRGRQKLALQDRMQSRLALPPLGQAELARSAAAADAQHYRRISLRGRWLVEHTLYLDNRQMNARQGFFVVTPLLLASGDAVLVQRGWTPRDFIDRSKVLPLATPAGEVEIVGRIAPPPSKLFELSGAESGPIRQNLDIPALALEIHVPLRPLSVQQLAPDGQAGVAAGADANLVRQWPAPAVDVGKHQGYAFQWFALCALITGLTLWFQILSPRINPSHGRPH